MTKGHSVSCADAVRTTPDECKCKCAGDFHGGPHTERVRALVWDPDDRESYSRKQVTTAKRRAREAIDTEVSVNEACTDFAVTHMVDVLIGNTGTSDQAAARGMLKAVVDPFVKEIVKAEQDGTLSGEESKFLETAVNNLHIICSLCVEILEAVENAKTLANEMAEEFAQAVIDGIENKSLLKETVRQVVKQALSRSFKSVIDLVADPSNVKLLQVVGFATCPNIKEHNEVEQYCVHPLEGDFINAALRDWIDRNFPRDSDILKPRNRRDEEDNEGEA